MIKHIEKLFLEKYLIESEKSYFAPGRVNIIGEHTDYNGGLVMPFCIDKGIYATIGKNHSKLINVYSENFSIHGIINIDLVEINYDKLDNYADYFLGVLKELSNMGLPIRHGLNILLSSNLPVGGGLSSSAALTLLFINILNDEYSYELDRLTMVKIARRVENNFLKVNCGIMDQFAIMYGKENCAIYLETDTLKFDYVNLDMDDICFVLINSNTTRKLSESKYNERQKETQEILSILQDKFNIKNLSDLSYELLNEALSYISSDVLKRRLKHVITENKRVKEAKKAITNKDIIKFGEIITAAHESLKKDYEVSSSVLDDLVEMALKSGSLGSRMIGGGFGGSTLNIVKTADFDNFIEKFQTEYQKYNDKPFIYSVVVAKDGIKIID